MGIKEKLEISSYMKRFTLFREGVFYKCYNEDAMVFAKWIKPYKVCSKYSKIIGADVLSLGFHTSEIIKGNLSPEMISERLVAVNHELENDKLTFFIRENIKQEYDSWCKAVADENSTGHEKKSQFNPVTQSTNFQKELIDLIKSFDLANSTPMQALNFIQKLKQKVHTVEENHGNI